MTSPSDESLARVAADHHGIFATHQLDKLKFSEDARHVRIATHRWDVLYDGVYRIAGAPPTWHGDLLAACWAGGTRSLASHRSAEGLWNLPSSRTDLIEVTCPRWRRTRHRGLVVHESTAIDDADRTVVEGIPCTSAARTLFDLARMLSPVMLDANIDNALRRELVSFSDLVSLVDRLSTKGRPGGRRFREVVGARVDGGSVPDSVPERLLADFLVKQGLEAPVLQFEVRDEAGRVVARVDLAYPDHRLAIEYDSFDHHLGKIALVRDSARRNLLTDLGFTVLTATAADIRDHGRRLASAIRSVRSRAA